MEQEMLLKALNTYAHKMKVGITDSPIIFREVQLNDTLLDDRLITDLSIVDADERIKKGYFESGNYFALTESGAFVYASEKVSRNMNCLFFIITSSDLDKAIDYHLEMLSKLKCELKYLKKIQEKTGTIISELEATINKS